MKIITCVKYVPQNDKSSYQGEKIIRNESGLINPADLFAIEEAVRIKEKFNAKTVALCMGVNNSIAALRDVIALGIDDAILLNDSVFAGSDTLATSYILSKGITRIGDYDLVLCGKSSTDGDTGQVAQEIAAHLDIPCITNVVSLEFIGNEKIQCEVLSDIGRVLYQTSLPTVISVLKGINEPRIATINNFLKSRDYSVEIWNSTAIGAEMKQCGIEGSPTKVKKASSYNFSSRNSIDISKDYITQINKLLFQARNNEYDNHIEQPILGNNSRSRLQSHKEIWAICENDKNGISEVSLQLLSKAAELSDELGAISCALCLGNTSIETQKHVACYGADKVISLSGCIREPFFNEYTAHALVRAIEKFKPEVVLYPNSVWGRWIAPFVAVKLSTGLAADCFDLEVDRKSNNLIQKRIAFGGSIVAEIICPNTRPQMSTVKANIFKKKRRNYIVPNVNTIELNATSIIERIKVVQNKAYDRKHSFVNADIIFAGGRGLGSKENFDQLKKFAALANCSVGASRYAVDAGWVEYDNQIGQTGFIVKPKLYIAFGISGASEHLIGMREADCIVSVNTDKNASMNAISDFVINDDCISVINTLINEYKVDDQDDICTNGKRHYRKKPISKPSDM